MSTQVKPKFVMVDVEATSAHLSLHNNAKGKDTAVLLFLLSRCNFGHMCIYFNLDSVCRHVKCNKLTAAHWVDYYLNHYLLIKVTRGVFWLNPKCFFAGTQEQKEAAKSKWDICLARLLDGKPLTEKKTCVSVTETEKETDHAH